MSKEVEGQECPFKQVACHSGCAAYEIRYREHRDGDEESFMICTVLKALGVDDV